MPEERDSEQEDRGERRGDMRVGGDYVGGDKVVHGDQVGGDKIMAGDVTGSTGVAIGRGSSAHVEHSQHTTVLSPFDEARRKLDEMALPQEDAEEAQFAIKQVEKEAVSDEPDIDRLDRWLGVLEEIAPDVAEVLTRSRTPAQRSGRGCAPPCGHGGRRAASRAKRRDGPCRADPAHGIIGAASKGAGRRRSGPARDGIAARDSSRSP